MKNSSEQKLIEFLSDIDARLAGEAHRGKIDLYIFGGAATVIAYGSKRGTVDIDAFLDDKRLREKLGAWAGQGSALAQKHGVYFQNASLILMPIEDPDWKARCREILPNQLKHIRVLALGIEDLILTKLGRYNDRDREDIRHLAASHKVGVDSLIDLYKSARRYYGGRLDALDLTFNIVLEEHFGRSRVDFSGD